MLTDPDKRAAYDRFGHAGVDPNAGGGAGGQGFGNFSDAFGDIFGDIFGGAAGRGGGGRSNVYRGSDLRYSMEITLEQAAAGFTTEIKVPSWETCDTCDGTGAKPGTKAETCKTCGGQGQVRMQQGFFSIQQTCPSCRGSGKTIPNPCSACDGVGRIRKQKTLEVKIPAGIDDGMRIRSSGNGEPGLNGGPSGDLYVEVSIKPHRVFQREGDDLHCEVPVSFARAALGGSIDVPTLNGKASFDLPEGTQTGKTFRLRGKGIRNVRSSVAGDLYCHVVVETPVKLNDRQRKILEDFEASLEEGGDRHSPQSKSWMEKVRDFFN
jgi:molecular chaperone DnaJ